MPLPALRRPQVRIYELTSVGKLLLKLLQNLNQEETAESVVSVPEFPRLEV